MAQTHSFPAQRTVATTTISFLVIAAALYFYAGPVGILYALGIEAVMLLIYRLTVAFADLLYPDVY